MATVRKHFVNLGNIATDGGPCLLELTGDQIVDDRNMWLAAQREYSSITMLRCLSKKSRKFFSTAGVVYSMDVEEKEDGQHAYVVGSAKPTFPYPQEEFRARVQGIALGLDRQKAAAKKQAQLEADLDILAGLNPIRSAYKNARGVNRQQILAAAVEYITR